MQSLYCPSQQSTVCVVNDMALQQVTYAGFSSAFSAGLAGMGLWLWFNLHESCMVEVCVSSLHKMSLVASTCPEYVTANHLVSLCKVEQGPLESCFIVTVVVQCMSVWCAHLPLSTPLPD